MPDGDPLELPKASEAFSAFLKRIEGCQLGFTDEALPIYGGPYTNWEQDAGQILGHC